MLTFELIKNKIKSSFVIADAKAASDVDAMASNFISVIEDTSVARSLNVFFKTIGDVMHGELTESIRLALLDLDEQFKKEKIGPLPFLDSENLDIKIIEKFYLYAIQPLIKAIYMHCLKAQYLSKSFHCLQPDDFKRFTPSVGLTWACLSFLFKNINDEIRTECLELMFYGQEQGLHDLSGTENEYLEVEYFVSECPEKDKLLANKCVKLNLWPFSFELTSKNIMLKFGELSSTLNHIRIFNTIQFISNNMNNLMKTIPYQEHYNLIINDEKQKLINNALKVLEHTINGKRLDVTKDKQIISSCLIKSISAVVNGSDLGHSDLETEPASDVTPYSTPSSSPRVGLHNPRSWSLASFNNGNNTSSQDAAAAASDKPSDAAPERNKRARGNVS